MTAGSVEICRCPHRRSVICMQSLMNCNNLFLMSLRNHTNRFSSTCLCPRTPVWPFIKSADPSLFIHLLFQLCEQWYICLQTPCPGKFLEKRIIGKNIACFWASSGIYISSGPRSTWILVSVPSWLWKNELHLELMLTSALGEYESVSSYCSMEQWKMNHIVQSQLKYHKMGQQCPRAQEPGFNANHFVALCRLLEPPPSQMLDFLPATYTLVSPSLCLLVPYLRGLW